VSAAWVRATSEGGGLTRVPVHRLVRPRAPSTSRTTSPSPPLKRVPPEAKHAPERALPAKRLLVVGPFEQDAHRVDDGCRLVEQGGIRRWLEG
jgi:hypothetical protein